ncbi:MAG: protein translocase subunit SecD [Acidimicrobiales bacterium]
MRRGLVWSLIGIIVVAVASLGATIASGNTPLLGLDLKGGVSVVLKPQGRVDAGILQQAVSIIERRVNGLGVANSNVARQGNDVVINLPGIKNSQNALKVLGQTAVLYFRPVYCTAQDYAAASPAKNPAKTPAKAPVKTPGLKPAGSSPSSGHAQGVAPLRSESPPTDLAAATRAAPSATSPTTVAPAPTPTTSPVPLTTPAPLSANAPLSQATCASSAANIPSTSPNADNSKATVLLPYYDNSVRYVLGPADLQGNVVANTSVIAPTTGGGYQVQVTFTGPGGNEFDRIAAQRYAVYKQDPSNPGFGALEAIELDGVVESAPAIEAATFNGTAVISGNTAAPFTSAQANNLALELRYGSLPVRFTPQSIQTISATIGKDSLKAGILAGLGGILLVLLYMVIYYRALGLVVFIGLCVGGSLLYSILTELSQTSSLALTLSGVTGIIVSIGITVDSYVVYFERLKDEVRAGRTIRSSVERSFRRAFRTVLTADFVSFLAALILYELTVGDVKGFAFTLGLSTLLDVFTAYFFIRPMVILVGRRRAFTEARFLGVARGLGAARTAEAAP